MVAREERVEAEGGHQSPGRSQLKLGEKEPKRVRARQERIKAREKGERASKDEPKRLEFEKKESKRFKTV